MKRFTQFIIGLVLVASSSAHAQDRTVGWWDNPSGHPGALAPENLNQERPAPPFDLTGTWMINGQWQFLPMPTLKPDAQRLHDMAVQAAAEGRSFNDVTGQCWPPGMPIVMTRVWPTHMIQLPTAIVMVMNFENQVRWIYLDGRDYTDPDIYAPTYNGESIGHWEGDTLVVETRGFETKKHFIDRSIPISEEFRITERFRMTNDGEMLEVEYIMTDPVNWEGEWRSNKRFRREHYADFLEVHCLPDLNETIPGANDEYSDFE